MDTLPSIMLIFLKKTFLLKITSGLIETAITFIFPLSSFELSPSKIIFSKFSLGPVFKE